MKQLFTIPIQVAAVLVLLPALQVTAHATDDLRADHGAKTQSSRALLPVQARLSDPYAATLPSPHLANLKLEGAWITTYQNEGPVLLPSIPETSLTLFHVDGGFITVNDLANPPGLYGGTQGLGEWASTADNQFAGTSVFVVSTLDKAGNGIDAGLFKQRWSVKYNESRNQLSGPYQWVWLDANGAVIFEGGGTITLKRIGVQPMSSTWN